MRYTLRLGYPTGFCAAWNEAVDTMGIISFVCRRIRDFECCLFLGEVSAADGSPLSHSRHTMQMG